MKSLYMPNGEYKRIFEVDLVRGLAIVLVLFDHFAYQFWAIPTTGSSRLFGELQELAVWYWNTPFRIAMQKIVVGTFFFVSGISSSFSKNNFARGMKLVLLATMLTVGSRIVAEIFGKNSIIIDFGVVHCFAFSILIYAFLQKLHPLLLFAVACMVFFASWYVPTLGIETTNLYLLPLGIAPAGYLYGDYYPLLPWLGFLVFGGGVGKILYHSKQSVLGKVYPKLSKPFLFLGRNSLFFYFGEQAILFPVFALISTLL